MRRACPHFLPSFLLSLGLHLSTSPRKRENMIMPMQLSNRWPHLRRINTNRRRLSMRVRSLLFPLLLFLRFTSVFPSDPFFAVDGIEVHGYVYDDALGRPMVVLLHLDPLVPPKSFPSFRIGHEIPKYAGRLAILNENLVHPVVEMGSYSEYLRQTQNSQFGLTSAQIGLTAPDMNSSTSFGTNPLNASSHHARSGSGDALSSAGDVPSYASPSRMVASHASSSYAQGRRTNFGTLGIHLSSLGAYNANANNQSASEVPYAASSLYHAQDTPPRYNPVGANCDYVGASNVGMSNAAHRVPSSHSSSSSSTFATAASSAHRFGGGANFLSFADPVDVSAVEQPHQYDIPHPVATNGDSSQQHQHQQYHQQYQQQHQRQQYQGQSQLSGVLSSSSASLNPMSTDIYAVEGQRSAINSAATAPGGATVGSSSFAGGGGLPASTAKIPLFSHAPLPSSLSRDPISAYNLQAPRQFQRRGEMTGAQMVPPPSSDPYVSEAPPFASIALMGDSQTRIF